MSNQIPQARTDAFTLRKGDVVVFVALNSNFFVLRAVDAVGDNYIFLCKLRIAKNNRVVAVDVYFIFYVVM